MNETCYWKPNVTVFYGHEKLYSNLIIIGYLICKV